MSSPPPNIVWIVTTQWRGQACGFAGDVNARTPWLDALARESVVFTEAVTPHPFGPFARAAMLTGVPSPENGVRDYYDPLPRGARTVAHALREHGYATGFWGKWHLAERDRAAPLVGEAHARMIVPEAARGGFEFWEGFESGFLLNDPWLHGTRLPEPERFHGYQADVVEGRARAWIAAQARPVFAVVSVESPHPPYDAPAAGVTPRAGEAITLAPNVSRGGDVEQKARRELAGYYAHIEATDRAIGRLVAGLDAERTIVVITSVHGDMHGAHGLFRKGWPHEESVRVPLLVRPARAHATAAGRTSGEMVSLLDLPRWTLAWARGEERAESGSGQRISMPSVVALPHQCDRAWRGWRTKTRKLVLNADGSPWLFFDRTRDPWEQHNLAAEGSYATEIAALRRAMGDPAVA